MGGERPKWIGSVLNIFRKPSMEIASHPEIERRFVKSTEIDIQADGKVNVNELKVELLPGEPDDMARVIAQTFRTGHTTLGSYNEKTGKFDIKDMGE
jgi:hypothetical protein